MECLYLPVDDVSFEAVQFPQFGAGRLEFDRCLQVGLLAAYMHLAVLLEPQSPDENIVDDAVHVAPCESFLMSF